MRLFTKSAFKEGLECPTRLFYYKKPDEYINNSLDDDFLTALAEGGYQVNALAHLYYPDGFEVSTLNHQKAIDETNNLIKKENVTIFEGAFSIDSFFIRVDVLIKTGKEIKLLEIKSKSYDPAEGYLNKNGTLKSQWKPYLFDVAFQKYVLQKVLPKYNISSYLLLVDKTKRTTVEGLHQKFLVQKDDNGRPQIIVHDAEVGEPILSEVNVNDPCEIIFGDGYTFNGKKYSFDDYINVLTEHYIKDERIFEKVRKECKSCPYKSDVAINEEGLKSGFHECWKSLAGFTKEDFQRPLVLDLWNYRKTQQQLDYTVYFMDQLGVDDLSSDKLIEDGRLTTSGRQWEQITRAVNKINEPYINVQGIKKEFEKFVHPLHFIDFEAVRTAIPFYKNIAPYDQLVFQFSHHKVEQKGSVAHAGQWLCTEQGAFPNFNFVRELRKSIGDIGTVFIYSKFENTALKQIYYELQESDEPDRNELCEWIRTLINIDEIRGERMMYDLKDDMLMKYYYDPYTNGSNSIKDVLPAVIKSSKYLREKYSAPVYGTEEMPSHNYKDFIWLDKGIINPYKKLPPIFENLNRENLDGLLLEGEDISEGGAAMIAYAKMQFTEMHQDERESIVNALLRYCELDTLAMVMIFEYLLNIILICLKI